MGDKKPKLDMNDLREEFAEMTVAADPRQTKISKILMVGAVAGGAPDAEFQGLILADYLRLHETMESLKENNFTLDPDFEVEVVNRMYGDDFLDGEYTADVVILCHVFHPKDENMALHYRDQGDHTFDTSPNHFKDNAWRDAVERTGASLVFVHPKDFQMRATTEVGLSRIEGTDIFRIENTHGHLYDLGMRQGTSASCLLDFGDDGADDIELGTPQI